MAFQSPFVACLGLSPLPLLSIFKYLGKRSVCRGEGGHASPRRLSFRSHVSVSKGLSNLTTFIVHWTHIDSVLPSIKGFAISRYSSLNVSDSSLAFLFHELGYLFELCQMGHIGEMFVRKEPLRAFSLNFFFPTFLDGETSCWFVKRRLINCSLSCRIAWFLKKLTKGLFQDSSILFRAHFQPIKSAAGIAPSTRPRYCLPAPFVCF